MIVLSGHELHVYQNPAPNRHSRATRLWADHTYRRLKQCHKYYSP